MTGVEFLLRQFALLGYDVHKYETIIKEAKEMEKEQKIDFACQVVESSAIKYIQGKTTRMIAEELLTFKSE